MIALRALVLFTLVLASVAPALAGSDGGYTGGPVESYVYNTGENDAG